MINLINKNLFDYQLPWGNADSGNHLWVCTPQNVFWDKDIVTFYVKKERIPGWYMDKSWNQVNIVADYSASMILSKELYHFGFYVLRCYLPKYRGTWPAFWFIDTTLPASQGGTGMGIPPEVDVFEYMRKKGFWRRWKTSHTYHDISSEGKYSDMICKSHCQLFPVDSMLMEFTFDWQPGHMIWGVNGSDVLKITPGDVKKYPLQPMNIVLGHAVGPWDIRDDKISPFIVVEFFKK